MNQLPRIPVIGIVGGIGSGKSAVARQTAELLPVRLIDCDQLGHQTLDIPDVQLKLRDAFGQQIFGPSNRVDRGALAKLVFGDDLQSQQRRLQLERIVHPPIQRQVQKEIQQARASGDVEAVLLDAAVLLESDWKNLVDAVVFLDVPAGVRLARVQQTRGWSREEWERREASQWPLDKKIAASNVVISNAGDVGQSAKRLADWILSLKTPLATQSLAN